jgi:hypothetical protein
MHRKRMAITALAVATALSLSAGDEERSGDIRDSLERTLGNFGPAEDGREKSQPILEKQGWVYLFDGRADEGAGEGALGLWRPPRSADLPEKGAARGGPEGAANHGNGPAVQVSTDGEASRLKLAPAHGLMLELHSRQSFWDFDMHVEVAASALSRGAILLRGRHEIAISPTPPDTPQEDLAPDDMGGVGGTRPPAANASRGPGEWQTLDVSLRGYRLALRLNGEPIHTDVEIPSAGDPRSPGPLVLRVTAGTIEIRSIRIRPRPAPAIWRNPPAREG